MTGMIVRARGVEKSYRSGQRETPVLQGVDLDVATGELVAIMGPSGCGKTTLLNCLSGLDTVDAGSMVVDGEELAEMSDRARTRHRSERMGFVFQAFNLVPVLTAQRNVATPLLFAGVGKRDAMERARDALERVGLGHRLDHRPTELSGGQQQRVAIARALVNDPVVVWADEPTGNLDQATGRDMLELVARLNEEDGVTFVTVTHDPGVAEIADRVLEVADGRVADGCLERAFQVVET